MAKISVLIPSYNHSLYIEKCIKRVINQTFKDIEIICVDDGSTDHTEEVLLGFSKKDSRIKLYDRTKRCYHKIIKRRNKYIVYLKSAEKIGDFLRAIGASQSVMNFEMTRIDRSMANTVNRWNNCDIANEMKAMSASKQQIEDIAYVMDKAGLEILDAKTREVALIRLENPELTLNELAEVYLMKTGQAISKSGLHHRFAKIKNEALKLKSMEEE